MVAKDWQHNLHSEAREKKKGRAGDIANSSTSIPVGLSPLKELNSEFIKIKLEGVLNILKFKN